MISRLRLRRRLPRPFPGPRAATGAPPASEPELRPWQRLLYASAVVGGTLTEMAVATWFLYCYAPPAGRGPTLAPITWAAGALVFGRVVDAAANPMVGYWSDRARHRWGRRIPFLAFGGLPTALVFVALWFPPVSAASAGTTGSVLNGVYAALVLGLFYFCFTVYFCPHGALLPEISSQSGERVSISILIALASLVSAVMVGVGSGILIERFGFRVAGPVMGLVALPFLYGPVAAIRERPRGEAEEVTSSFREAVVQTFRNRPFVIWTLSSVFGYLAQNMLMGAIPYFVTVVLGGTESQMGYLMGMSLLVAVVSFPLVSRLAAAWGKARVYQLSQLLGALFVALLFVVGRFDLSLSPLAQTMVLVGLSGVAFGPAIALPQAILADTIDYEYEMTGKRRSAMYLGLQGVMQKAAVALAPLTVSVLFSVFGYSPARPLGIYLVGPVAGLLLFCGWVVFLAYPLRDR